MTQVTLNDTLGRKIAPPRFLLFLAVFVLGLAGAVPVLDWGPGTMAAFDGAAIVFLLSIAPFLWRAKPDVMRRGAAINDANRVLLLAITGLLSLVVLVAVHYELRGKTDTGGLVLVLVTLVLAWLFSNVIYALHYAHIFYLPDGDGQGDRGGLSFPGTPEPEYSDFIYFSFTLGMTFQTSDVNVTSSQMRRVMVGHCLAAFVFNIGVLAFTINVVGGGSGGGGS